MTSTITCPSCRTKIQIDEALTSELSTQIEGRLQTQYAKREAALSRQQSVLQRRELELQEQARGVESQVAAKLKAERAKLEASLRASARAELAEDIRQREQEMAALRGKLQTAQKQELALRKRERELADQAEALKLEVARRLDAEREQIKAQTRKAAHEEHALAQRAKDKQIEDLRTQIDDLKLKAEQGSVQLHGEVQEMALEDLLHAAFPSDDIMPVGKGRSGADVLQRVRDAQGRDCGLILWESKRTRTWQDAWLPKLRDDQREAKAAVAALATQAMPRDCATFAQVEGVWVSHWSCVTSVAAALRMCLLQVARATQAQAGRDGKMEMLYEYLSGSEFRNHMAGIAEAFITMRADLDAERRAMQRQWSKRQKQLDRALANTAGMYGDLQGIFGGNLAQIDALEIPALEAAEA